MFKIGTPFSLCKYISWWFLFIHQFPGVIIAPRSQNMRFKLRHRCDSCLLSACPVKVIRLVLLFTLCFPEHNSGNVQFHSELWINFLSFLCKNEALWFANLCHTDSREQQCPKNEVFTIRNRHGENRRYTAGLDIFCCPLFPAAIFFVLQWENDDFE